MFIGQDIHAVPAYGRDYKSKDAVLKDWNDGKDFQDYATNRYLSIRDDLPVQIWVRYDKLRKVVRVK